MRLKHLRAILCLCLVPAVAPRAEAAQPDPTTLYPATWYPGVTDSTEAVPVTLGAGETASGLTIPLASAGGVVRVRILAEGDSAAVPGILVEAVRGSITAVALTDNDGVAVIEGVPAGPAIIRVRPDDPRSENGSFIVRALDLAVPVADGTVSDAGDLLVPHGGRIKVLVRRPTGDPWSGIPVVLRSAEDAFRMARSTGSDGRAHLSGLSPGLYRLWADTRGTDAIPEAWDGSRDTLASTPIDVAAGALIDGIEITPDLGGTISGSVRDAGSNVGLPDVGVEVKSVLDPPTIYRFRTQELGFYVANGLPTGQYKIHVPAINRWYPDTPFEDQARPVQATEGETTHNVDLRGILSGGCQLPPGAAGTVEGSVRIDFTIVPEARIVVWNDQDTLATTITTGPAYSITCVPPGSYRAAIYPRGVYRKQYHPKTNDPDSALVFSVAQGDTTRRIDFEPQRSVTLEGSVIDRDQGGFLPGIPVLARLETPHLAVAATTGEDGFFRFDTLADGTGLPEGVWTIATDSLAIVSLAVVPVRSVGLSATRVADGIRLDMEIPEVALSGWSIARSDGRTVATASDTPGGIRTRSCIDRGADGSLSYRLTVELEAGGGPLESPWTEPLPARGSGASIGPIPWNGVKELRLPSDAHDGKADLYSTAGRRIQTFDIVDGKIMPHTDSRRIPTGIYFLRWRTSAGAMRSERIVVAR